MQIATLNVRLKYLKNKGTVNSSGNKTKLSESDSRISQFAKLFGVMHEPFVPPSALLVARPDMSSSHPKVGGNSTAGFSIYVWAIAFLTILI